MQSEDAKGDIFSLIRVVLRVLSSGPIAVDVNNSDYLRRMLSVENAMTL